VLKYIYTNLLAHIGVVSLWLLLAGKPITAVAQQHAPKLICEQPTFNFGERESAPDFDHDFVIRNAGDLALQIFNLRTTCGCLVPSFTKRIIPPGGTATVTVRFIARGRQGPQSKVLFIESNDPAHPSFPLRMEGQIIDPVEIKPSLLFFGRLAATSCSTGTLTVSAIGTNLLGSIWAQIDSPAFTVSVTHPVSNKTASLTVATKPPLPEGLTRAMLRINTGCPHMPILTTVVSAFVPGTFSVVPPELLLVGREDEPVRREVVVRSESNITFRVISVEPPLTNITCTITPTNSSTCRLIFPGLPVSHKLDGQIIRIVTDHPRHSEILLPIRVFIR
jgi:hypothetical protein